MDVTRTATTMYSVPRRVSATRWPRRAALSSWSIRSALHRSGDIELDGVTRETRPKVVLEPAGDADPTRRPGGDPADDRGGRRRFLPEGGEEIRLVLRRHRQEQPARRLGLDAPCAVRRHQVVRPL